MSGGVDSAVAAYLLKAAGYDVTGVTLRVWQSDAGEDGRCCDIDDARDTAFRIGIPYYPINCTSVFNKRVVDPFVDGYLRGTTPNPCIECNRFVKWEKLVYYAKALGAKYVATGHYASVVRNENGRFTLKRALHSEKDQTYMLYKLTQEQLAATLMPLGELSKSEVRQIAKDAQFSCAGKRDSQEVCFVTGGSYADFIEARTGKIGDGLFVDEAGRSLGEHRGYIRYTVGQRKGLGIALGHPAYVKEIRPETNEVVIGSAESLYSRGVICDDVNYMSVDGIAKGDGMRACVKIRYRAAGKTATVESIAPDRVRIIFDEPARGAAPGQSAVFYDERGCIIGGGVIAGIIR